METHQIENQAGIILETCEGCRYHADADGDCEIPGNAGNNGDEAGKVRCGEYSDESPTYYVRLGGSPPESAEEYDTAEAALAGAIKMARDMAAAEERDECDCCGGWIPATGSDAYEESDGDCSGSIGDGGICGAFKDACPDVPVEEWGSESEIGEGGWGVCPADDSGAYWPYIYTQ